MSGISRRSFIKWSFFSCIALAASGYSYAHFSPGRFSRGPAGRKGMFYQALEGGAVQCRICRQACIIEPGGEGKCRSRVAHDGAIYSTAYGRPAAVVVEPLEKEPLYHFLPGSRALCIGTAGCNFRCKNCHNWQLSQRGPEELDRLYDYEPRELVDLGLSRKVTALSFTYNEPAVFFEYMYHLARQAREEGLRVVLHTNGYLSPEPLRLLLPYLDAVAVDLKGFTDDFYRQISGGSLAPVLQTLQEVHRTGTWLEVVNLVIPGLNDDYAQIGEMCRWILNNLGPDTPLHFSRFFPAYRLVDLSPTPLETLEAAHAIAREAGLSFVTLGNTPGHVLNSTFCPSCGNVLVERHHIAVKKINIEAGFCRFCRASIPGVWS